MLEETFKEWERRAKREGRAEGRLEATRYILLRQIRHRFGHVPKGVREQVNAISSLRELEKITDKILTVGSLQELGLG